MRTFVAREKDKLRRVAVIATMNAGGATNAFAEVADILGHGVMRRMAIHARAIEDGSGTGDLIDFGAALQPGAAGEPQRQAAWTDPEVRPGAAR